MARLVLFAAAREAAGTKHWEAEAATVGALLDAACAEFGDHFAKVVDHSKVWRNGEPAERGEFITDGDEVAVLPPVSGG
jgi:sulfur-carrier protein